MTLLVSVGLLVLGALAALRLPRVMECGAQHTELAPGLPEQRTEQHARVPAAAGVPATEAAGSGPGGH